MSEIGARLIESAKEALAFAAGETQLVVRIPTEIDVKAIRTKLRMTQRAFASTFGFPLTTLRDWEQGRSSPESSARAYLTVIARDPEAVQKALRGAFGGLPEKEGGRRGRAGGAVAADRVGH